MTEPGLDTLNSCYGEFVDGLPRLYTAFKRAAEDMYKELTSRLRELERREEHQRKQLEDYKTRVDDLEKENRSLRHYKTDCDNLNGLNQSQERRIQDYSSQIESLHEQNRMLIERCERAERELAEVRANENRRMAEVDHLVSEHRAALDQMALEQKTELANQATAHQTSIAKAKRSFEEALKKLRVDIDMRTRTIENQKEQIQDLRKQIKMLPVRLHTQCISAIKQLPLDQPQPLREINEPLLRRNPARDMHRAIAGSSMSSSTSSTSSFAQPHRHKRKSYSADPDFKYPRHN